MMQNKQASFWRHNRSLLFSILLLLIAAIIICQGLQQKQNTIDAEGIRIAEQSIRRAVICCYALEGHYPQDFAYIRAHYGVMLDEQAYYVDYQIFSSNIMPQIRVTALEKQE